MGEDCGADGARPHAQTGGKLAGHLRVAGQVLPQAALVHVELSTHGARVVCAPSLCWVAGRSIRADLRAGYQTHRAPRRHWGPCGQTSCAPSTARRSYRACCRWGNSWGWDPPPGTGAAKKTFMSCNSSKTGLKYVRTIRPLPDSARVKEKELKVSPRRILQERRPAVQRQSGCGEKSPNLDLDFAATARQNRQA